MSVTLVTVVSLWIIVWLLRPGPEYVSVNWNAAPGVVILYVGVAVIPFHDEVTPFIVTFTSPAVGDKVPLVVSIPLPVAEYWYPVL